LVSVLVATAPCAGTAHDPTTPWLSNLDIDLALIFSVRVVH
jgi:hypothetical protein